MIVTERDRLGLGLLYIVIGLLANEWFLAVLFSPDGDLSYTNILLIRIFNFLSISFGLLTIYIRNKGLMINLNIMLISLVFVSFIVEVYLNFNEIRVMLGIGLTSRVIDLRKPDPYLHHTLKKNAAVISSWGGFRTLYYTNSLGYRDSHIKEVLPTSKSQYRILFLGDSFTESVGVNYEDSFIGKLDDLFRQNGRDTELLNSGVVSYSPSLAFRKLKQFLDEGYYADEVIFMFDLSDIHDEIIVYLDWHDEIEGIIKEWENMESVNENKVRPRMVPYILWRIELLLEHTPIDTTEIALWNGLGNWTEDEELRRKWQEGINICQEYIVKMSELCEKENIQFSFVIWPWAQQIMSDRKPSLQQEIFSEFAQANSIRLYDLYPYFLREDDWLSMIFHGDIHWTEKGHEAVAHGLYNLLSD